MCRKRTKGKERDEKEENGIVLFALLSFYYKIVGQREMCVYIYIGRREVCMETVKRVNEIGKSEL